MRTKGLEMTLRFFTRNFNFNFNASANFKIKQVEGVN